MILSQGWKEFHSTDTVELGILGCEIKERRHGFQTPTSDPSTGYRKNFYPVDVSSDKFSQ